MEFDFANIPIIQMETLEKKYKISLHMVASKDSVKFYIVNGKTFKEGDNIFAGYTIDEVQNYLEVYYEH